MRLSRREHPETGEATYQYVDWGDGNLVKTVYVCADRIEIFESTCETSGHAERYEPVTTRVHRRSDLDWPTAALDDVRSRFDEPLARAVKELLVDEGAFR